MTTGFKWIWREQFVSDYGVDAHMEAVSQSGEPTGQLFAVQIKTGPSYFRGSEEVVHFYVSEAHLAYWSGHVLPVVLVLHDPDRNTTIWQWANFDSARRTEQGWCIDIPKIKAFQTDSRAELLDQVWDDDSVGLRRRFAIDRQFMKEFQNRDAFATIDKWVNKSLQYRGIEIRFDNPDKDSADFEIPIMATWNYEISDVMQHFLPWLEYDNHEEVDDTSGEIERHVLAVRLSKYANAFLEVEAFFDNPSEHFYKLVSDDNNTEVDDNGWDDAHSLDEP